jgi:hypothetical protein
MFSTVEIYNNITAADRSDFGRGAVLNRNRGNMRKIKTMMLLK